MTTSIVASSTPAPPAVSGPAAYTYEPQGTVHVIYRGGDGHVHELYNGGYWVHVDLALQAQAPDIVGDPAGYAFDNQGTKHVVYRGADGHINELWSIATEGLWHHNDLTNGADGPTAVGAFSDVATLDGWSQATRTRG